MTGNWRKSPALPNDPDLLSVDAAREWVLTTADRVARQLADPTRDVSPVDGLGLVLAAEVVATTDLPPWDNSAMDGYAVRAVDVEAASEAHPAVLEVIGEAAAGAPATVGVRPGTAVRIATGAPLAFGADAVVAVELTTPLDPGGAPIGPRGRDAAGPLPARCAVHVAVTAGTSIRRRGEDLRGGTVVLEAGTTLTPPAISLAAGAGAGRVTVRRRPRIAVLATGDEVRSPDEPIGPAGIPDANGPGLRAMVTAAGGDVVDLGIARDDLDDVLERLRQGIGAADAIIVSGGVSVGPYDVVRRAFEVVGRIDLWRVAVQPGKPFAFGTADRPADDGSAPKALAPGAVLLFGLPGNPVSSYVTFELFVRPAIRRLGGHDRLYRDVDRAVLLEAVTKAPGRRAFLRARAVRDAQGQPIRTDDGFVQVRLAGGQGSHVLSALALTDCLAVVPETVESVPQGTRLELWWLDRS